MKKTIALIFCLLLIFSACKKGNQSESINIINNYYSQNKSMLSDDDKSLSSVTWEGNLTEIKTKDGQRITFAGCDDGEWLYVGRINKENKYEHIIHVMCRGCCNSYKFVNLDKENNIYVLIDGWWPQLSGLPSRWGIIDIKRKNLIFDHAEIFSGFKDTAADCEYKLEISDAYKNGMKVINLIRKGKVETTYFWSEKENAYVWK